MKGLFYILRDVFAFMGVGTFIALLYWQIRVKPKYDRASKLIDLAAREQKLWLKYLFTDPEKAEAHKEGAAAAWAKYNEIMGSVERKK